MATSQLHDGWSSEEEDEFCCGICMELMEEIHGRGPRTLSPCGHTLCSTCAVKAADLTRGLSCPECRSEVQSLTPNYSLREIIRTAGKRRRLRKESLQRAVDVVLSAHAAGAPLGSGGRPREVLAEYERMKRQAGRAVVLEQRLSKETERVRELHGFKVQNRDLRDEVKELHAMRRAQEEKSAALLADMGDLVKERNRLKEELVEARKRTGRSSSPQNFYQQSSPSPTPSWSPGPTPSEENQKNSRPRSPWSSRPPRQTSGSGSPHSARSDHILRSRSFVGEEASHTSQLPRPMTPLASPVNSRQSRPYGTAPIPQGYSSRGNVPPDGDGLVISESSSEGEGYEQERAGEAWQRSGRGAISRNSNSEAPTPTRDTRRRASSPAGAERAPWLKERTARPYAASPKTRTTSVQRPGVDSHTEAKRRSRIREVREGRKGHQNGSCGKEKERSRSKKKSRRWFNRLFSPSRRTSRVSGASSERQ